MRPYAALAEIGANSRIAIATAVGDNFVWAYQRAGHSPKRWQHNFQEAGIDSDRHARDRPREMGAGFGEMKSVAKLEAKPIVRATSGYRHARVLRRRADVRHDHVLAGLAFSTRCRSGAGLVLGRRPTRIHGEPDARVRTRPRPTCALRRRRLLRRQQESRDRLKGIQRQLRDHYRGIANQTPPLNESLQASLAAAKLERTNAPRGSRTRAANSTSCAGHRARREPVAKPEAQPEPLPVTSQP